MGLTIHYGFAFDGPKAVLERKLNAIRQEILGLPVSAVGLVRSVVATESGDRDEFELAKMMKISDDFPSDRSLYCGYANGLILRVNVGPGCESFTIILGRLGKSERWRGGHFTKTQYAEEFLKAHLLVVRMLDICKAHGILARVYDEGDFYETRDLKVLARNINESTAFIAALYEGLRKALGEGNVESPIAQTQNYMVVQPPEVEKEVQE